jgi:hypothetical protein
MSKGAGIGFPLEAPPRRWITGVLLNWFSGGVGAGFVYILFEFSKSQPQVISALLRDWGDNFILLIALMILGNRYMSQTSQFQSDNIRLHGESIRAQGDSVRAQERLAENVGKLVEKDDQRAREQDIMLNHLARGNEEIIGHLKGLSRAGAENLQRLDDLACMQKKPCDLK